MAKKILEDIKKNRDLVWRSIRDITIPHQHIVIISLSCSPDYFFQKGGLAEIRQGQDKTGTLKFFKP
ncbi:MAG: hypothetical protein J7M18_01705, partial [Candidatus Eremiobacteraeota bacterium]|nr:hypothetical protein [Candidatus Eremiobacteraeota bacterium]